MSGVLKILIAGVAESFQRELQGIFAAEQEVYCAADGIAAWSLLQKMRPDLLVLDLELSQIDGVSLLHRMRSGGFNPAVLVIARLISDYTVDVLSQMKVDYLLRKPCKAGVAAERAKALLQYYIRKGAPEPAAIAAALDALGIPSKLRGSKYLVEAVTLMAKDPSQCITKELYPAIGKKFGIDGSRVERCIRTAIAKGWENGNRAVWEKYLDADARGVMERPSNTAFIVCLVKTMKKET